MKNLQFGTFESLTTPTNKGKSRAVSKSCEKVEVFYSCESTSARTGFSDDCQPLPLPYKASVRQFTEDCEPNILKTMYERQVRCSMYGDMFLRMHFLHLSKKRILSEDYKWSLLTWLEERKRSKNDWGEEWWQTIREDFIAIFKPVCQGLKKMHLKNEYHGNLSMTDGIKIQVYDTHVRGVLTNMALQDAPSVQARDEKLVLDVQHLCEIIKKVLEFPFKQDGVPKRISDEVTALCLTQLRSYSRRRLLIIRWALDPVLFWNINRRISFLRSMHWMFYRHGKSNPVLVRNSVFGKWKDGRNSYLTKVYYFVSEGGKYDPSKYSLGYSLILFYRNCIEHVDFASMLEANDPARIHELFMKSHDVLLPSIRTINKLLTLDFTTTENKRVKLFLESVANQIEI